MNTKWVFQIGFGLILAVVILNLMPMVSGFTPQAPPMSSAPEASAPEASAPEASAPEALAYSPASVGEVTLANPPAPSRPLYTAASPMPRVASSGMVVQSQPSLDPTMNAIFAQREDSIMKTSLAIAPDMTQSPPMYQDIVGMKI